jgi:dTDP-4-dehydrorhamnose 3,5-epimerase
MMRITTTDVAGVMEVRGAPAVDSRGSFVRSWCRETFSGAGISFDPNQISLSTNIHSYTLRGMHYQVDPHGECKLVRCVRGAVWDVALDLRPDSPSYLKWTGLRLDPEGSTSLFIPTGCAHGFLSLTDDAVVEYMIDVPYVPEAARGVRWNDPRFGIEWPAQPKVISDHDRDLPDYVR